MALIPLFGLLEFPVSAHARMPPEEDGGGGRQTSSSPHHSSTTVSPAVALANTMSQMLIGSALGGMLGSLAGDMVSTMHSGAPGGMFVSATMVTANNGDLVYETHQHYRDCSGRVQTSHQRGINEQAKKVVRERSADGETYAEHFRNVPEAEQPYFDQRWAARARGGNALPSHHDAPPPATSTRGAHAEYPIVEEVDSDGEAVGEEGARGSGWSGWSGARGAPVLAIEGPDDGEAFGSSRDSASVGGGLREGAVGHGLEREGMQQPRRQQDGEDYHRRRHEQQQQQQQQEQQYHHDRHYPYGQQSQRDPYNSLHRRDYDTQHSSGYRDRAYDDHYSTRPQEQQQQQQRQPRGVTWASPLPHASDLHSNVSASPAPSGSVPYSRTSSYSQPPAPSSSSLVHDDYTHPTRTSHFATSPGATTSTTTTTTSARANTAPRSSLSSHPSSSSYTVRHEGERRSRAPTSPPSTTAHGDSFARTRGYPAGASRLSRDDFSRAEPALHFSRESHFNTEYSQQQQRRRDDYGSRQQQPQEQQQRHPLHHPPTSAHAAQRSHTYSSRDPDSYSRSTYPPSPSTHSRASASTQTRLDDPRGSHVSSSRMHEYDPRRYAHEPERSNPPTSTTTTTTTAYSPARHYRGPDADSDKRAPPSSSRMHASTSDRAYPGYQHRSRDYHV